ncbi:MAG: hypothetical protein ACLFTJ_14370 [Halothece sp.]
MKYKTIEELIEKISDEKIKASFNRLLSDHGEKISIAPGSSGKHQAWKGGYKDHLQEIMNLACVLYESLSNLRQLPFKLEDALIVLFLHDLEKPWKYAGLGNEEVSFKTKEEKQAFRRQKMEEYEIQLTNSQTNALLYIEGENEDYDPNQRVMGPLASFCHICDNASARIWFDRPMPNETEWGQRTIQ